MFAGGCGDCSTVRDWNELICDEQHNYGMSKRKNETKTAERQTVDQRKDRQTDRQTVDIHIDSQTTIVMCCTSDSGCWS